MRGRTKLVSLATVVIILLTTSMVFASGVIDASRVSLFNQSPMEPMAGSPSIFIDPGTIIKDYVNDPGYQIGNTLHVRVNVSDVTDLFSYQVNLTWTAGMLDFVGVTYNYDMLNSTGSYGSSAFYETIAPNETGTALIAETVLGDISGVSIDGALFTADFEILGYGNCTINIGTTGLFPTTLLDHLGNDITPAPGDIGNCYFKNKIFGDSNGDGMVTGADVGTLSDYWTGPPPGLYPYDRDVDQIFDGAITGADVGAVSDNWLRSAGLP